MTPQFYPVEEGYKIYLARSPKDDPKLRYRKEAQKRARKAKFTTIGRRILNHLRIDLGLTTEEAEAIKAEVLRPYQEYLKKLQEYEQAFKDVVEQEYPLSDYTRNELKDFQELLELRNEDIAPIEKRLVPQLQFDVISIDAQGREVKREKGQAQYFTEDLGNGVTLDMVAIPGGTFMMGSPEGKGHNSEKPQHKVKVQPFFIGKYPVTQAQWRAISKRSASRGASREDLKVERDLKPDPFHFKGDNRPLELVSWDDAVEFCQRLSQQTGKEYRLPSEAQWEYACRAGKTTPFHFGETITGELANYNAQITYANEPKGEYRGTTKSVGSFPPNAFGLYDMHGNVWEWCEDDWHENYQGAPTDGSAWLSGKSNTKVRRGGSWDDNPNLCRSAFRFNDSRGDRDFDIGFRVVCVVPRTT